MTRSPLIAVLLLGCSRSPPTRDVPFVRQSHPATCLIACATMVLQAQADPVTHDELWSRVRFWNDGTSDFDVQNAVASRGFRAWTFHGSEQDLKGILAAGYPVIVELDGPRKHAVVVVGSANGLYRLHDPARSAPMAEQRIHFLDRWGASGRHTLLIVSDRDFEPRLRATAVNVERIAAQNHRYRAEAWRRRARLDYPDERDERRQEMIRLARWEETTSDLARGAR